MTAEAPFTGHLEREIDQSLRGVRFSPVIEKLYEDETLQGTVRSYTRRLLRGLAVFDAFLVPDYFWRPDLISSLLAVKLLIVTPLVLLACLVIRTSRRTWIREAALSSAILVAGAGIIYQLFMDAHPSAGILGQAISLVVVFSSIVLRPRFWYLVTACTILNLMYAVAVSLAIGMSDAMFGLTMLGVATAFSLFGASSLERERRMIYLMSLKSRIRNTELEIMSNKDSLTGLLNRRALDQKLQEIEVASLSEQVGLSVIIFDIDHFKNYNDLNGHQAGDECLKRVAGIAEKQLRTGQDLMFRYGGEEFLLIVYNTRLYEACRTAERIRSALEGARLPHPDNDGFEVVTASFGVSHAVLAGVSPGDVISAADDALYAAKRAGRNQVWPATPKTVRAGLEEKVPACA